MIEEQHIKNSNCREPKTTVQLNQNIDIDDLVEESCVQTNTRQASKMKKTFKIQNEECSAFGQYIASKLIQYDLETRALVEHKISNIIFETDVEKCKKLNVNGSSHLDDVNKEEK